jgi:hypothetical protein
LLDSKIPVVAIPFCDDSVPTYFLEEERHSILMDRRVHYYLHKTRGTQYVSGGNISGYTVGVDTNVAHTIALSEVVIADEDIIITSPALPDPDGVFLAYLTFFPEGAGIPWDWADTSEPFVYGQLGGNGNIQWNNNSTLQDGAGSHFYTSYIIATNIIQSTGRYVIIPGEGEFNTLAEAQAEDPRNFNLTSMPVQEWAFLWKMIWQLFLQKSHYRYAAHNIRNK